MKSKSSLQLGNKIKLVMLLSLFALGHGISDAANPSAARGTPPLSTNFNIVQDPVGKTLQEGFIWTDQPREQSGVCIGFRRSFELVSKPSIALLHLFADARYILWVNGTYVDRGPSRFQLNGPEYDTINIAPFLKSGKNVVAVLVAGNLTGGKVMRHRPGLTASLVIDGKSLWNTDNSWRWSDRTRYRLVKATWPNLWDAEVDARVEDGNWMEAAYDDSSWRQAQPIGGSNWGPLTASRIPRLKETEVPLTLSNGAVLPVALKEGEKLEFNAPRFVQAYPVIEFTAEEGTELSVKPYDLHYVAKAGPQTHFTFDTFGLPNGSITVTKGAATITGLKLIERLYPYERLASFESDDPFLNRLWEMSARTCELLSEDAYVDCADRERVEWMDCSPPAFDITRTAMAGLGPDGKKIYGDPRLLEVLVRRTALTLQPDGWVKAHTCSDRYDIHAKMEDRTCAWVEGIRLYYEATGNTEVVREIWPAVVAQMNYFLERRNEMGLVTGRDWVVWGNPLGYATGATTTLNSFVYKALVDSSYLAGVLGDDGEKAQFAKAAEELAKAINTSLWNEQENCYWSGYFTEEDLAISAKSQRPVKMQLSVGLSTPTIHGNLFALNRGVVPADRRDKVLASILKMKFEPKRAKWTNVMLYYYLFKELYALDTTANDTLVLDYMREAWRPMVESPWQCAWEGFNGGSKAHIYGMHPGYFLSAYVLGVRRDAPVADKQLLIEPHLGNLNQAKGTVVTEFGPVSVSWTRNVGKLDATLDLPSGPAIQLALPRKDGVDSVTIDGKAVQGEVRGNRLCLPISPGKHTIAY
jgi:alpha-L-rhamnosidase